MILDRLSELIGAIYAAAEKSELWPDFLLGLCDLTGSRAATLVVADWQDPIANVSAFVRFDSETVSSSHREPVSRGVWLAGSNELIRHPERAYPDRQLTSQGRGGSSALANEFLAPIDASQAMCVTIAVGGRATAVLTCNYRKETDHETEHREIIELLVPHVQRAIVIHRRLRGSILRRQAMHGALDRQLIGAIMLESQRDCPQRMNREAERILAERDGLSMSHGHIVAALPSENRGLQSMIQQTRANTLAYGLNGGSVLRISRPSAKTPYSLIATPVSTEGDLFKWPKTVTVILLTDPDRMLAGAEPSLRELFGLTSAEARIALALMNGHRTSEIAERFSISENTLRTHLKHIYAKSGVPGQATLVRLLHRSLFDAQESL